VLSFRDLWNRRRGTNDVESGMRKIILHIGTYKTGSTAIQAFMRQNERSFRSRGILYPTFQGDTRSHTFLRKAVWDDDTAGVRDCIDILQRAFAKRPNATVVLSSEHFWPLRAAPLQRMLDELTSITHNIHTVMYVRPQDRLWSSLYAQEAKFMRVRPEHELWGAKGFVSQGIIEGMYYFECLEAYAGRFGRENVTARLYNRKLFPQGDVVEDFLSFLGVSVRSWPWHGKERNESYGWKAVEFSKHCAVHYARKAGRDVFARNVNSAISTAMRQAVLRLATRDGFPDWLGKVPNYLSPDDQRAIHAHYAESNANLFKHYFGGKDVFHTDDLLPACPYKFADIPRNELQLAFRYMNEAFTQNRTLLSELA
jgi:hypothetical protein